MVSPRLAGAIYKLSLDLNEGHPLIPGEPRQVASRGAERLEQAVAVVLALTSTPWSWPLPMPAAPTGGSVQSASQCPSRQDRDMPQRTQCDDPDEER
jgi:hypothetical protein